MIYSIDQLKEAYMKGEKFRFLFFWGHTPSTDGTICASCLSQWWMSNFIVDGVTYTCTEQFMMAEKARMFHDDEMLNEIMQAKHPKEMKAFGRAVRNFKNELWDSSCYSIVKKGNTAKFSQNKELCDFLCNTKNRILVEASPRDRIWGIGMGKQNPDAENPIKWRGKNLLGFALTETRDLIINSKSKEES